MVAKSTGLLVKLDHEKHLRLRALSKIFSLPLAQLIEAMLDVTSEVLPQSVTDYVSRCVAADGLVETAFKEAIWPKEDMARQLLEKRGSWAVVHRDEWTNLLREVDRQKAFVKKLATDRKQRDQRLSEASSDRTIYAALVSVAAAVVARGVHLDESCTPDLCVCEMSQLAMALVDSKGRLVLREEEEKAAEKDHD